MRSKLDSARFEYSWIFCNGEPEEQSANSGFKQYLKRIFLSGNTRIPIPGSGNKFYNNMAANYIKPKRKWILFESLQML